MSLKRQRSLVWLVVLVLMFSVLAGVTGCKTKSDEEPGAAQSDSQNQAGETSGEGQTGGGGEGQSATKVLALGEKGSNKAVSEVEIAKATVVDNLSSADAVALLQNGAPGESPEADKKPASGNELLVVTFSYKAKQEKILIRPTDIKLVDGDGVEYQEVSTSGHGGIYNQDPPEVGVSTQVSAVYEVPEGKTGLVLTYQPWGDTEVVFKVR